jgi:hypothetical protein
MNFDFISQTEFRQSLEADFQEMIRCSETGAWKSVSVLAGSIVEALLIDYLVATKEGRTGKDPLKMDLAEAIALCRAEGVLTERTSDLSSVVRSYRNLIHPGRTVRLKEATPNESTAAIAQALVKLIVSEVAEKRKAAFGLTGEQIVSKLDRDSGSLAILKHLLDEVSDVEKTRLILDLIPRTYFASLQSPDDSPFEPEVQERLKKAYRVVLATLPAEADQAAAAKFVNILKNEDGQTITAYARAFFRGQDMDFVSAAHQGLVKDFLLSQMQPTLSHDVIEMILGFESTLVHEDKVKWVDPIIKTITSGSGPLVRAAKEYFAEALSYTSRDFDRSVERRLTDWQKHYEERNVSSYATLITELKAQVPPPEPPRNSTDASEHSDDDLPF